MQNQIVVCLIRTIVLAPIPDPMAHRVSLDGFYATKIGPDPLVGAFFVRSRDHRKSVALDP
jgi:hypothetical protein